MDEIKKKADSQRKYCSTIVGNCKKENSLHQNHKTTPPANPKTNKIKQNKKPHHTKTSALHLPLSGNKLLLHTYSCGRKGDIAVLNSVIVFRSCVFLASNIFKSFPKQSFLPIKQG